MKDLLKLSRRMSFLLRHGPQTADLSMSHDGSVKIQDLKKVLGISTSTLLKIVEEDKKGRYVISGERIWAAQGHSIDVQVPLEEVTESKILFHGTKTSFLDSIMSLGLVRGDRTWVHLSETIETADSVASRRSGKSVILEIDSSKMLSEGLQLFRASNGVILSDSVPPRFITPIF